MQAVAVCSTVEPFFFETPAMTIDFFVTFASVSFFSFSAIARLLRSGFGLLLINKYHIVLTIEHLFNGFCGIESLYRGLGCDGLPYISPFFMSRSAGAQVSKGIIISLSFVVCLIEYVTNFAASRRPIPHFLRF